MFTRERNITQALIKNNGISAAREETKETTRTEEDEFSEDDANPNKNDRGHS